MNSASQIGITLGELITVAVAIIGVLWMLGKSGLGQLLEKFEIRFTNSDKSNAVKFEAIDTKLKTFDSLHGELARVDKDLVQVRLEMATNFVRQEGLRNLQLRMEQLFGEVFDKLEAKIDRNECGRFHDK